MNQGIENNNDDQAATDSNRVSGYINSDSFNDPLAVDSTSRSKNNDNLNDPFAQKPTENDNLDSLLEPLTSKNNSLLDSVELIEGDIFGEIAKNIQASPDGAPLPHHSNIGNDFIKFDYPSIASVESILDDNNLFHPILDDNNQIISSDEEIL